MVLLAGYQFISTENVSSLNESNSKIEICYIRNIPTVIDLLESKEVYEHRADKLLTRERNHKTNWITENFSPGRPKHLKSRSFP